MINLNDVKTLLNSEDKQVISVYLRIDPALRENQADNPAWRIWLKNAVRDAERDMRDSKREIWEDRKERLYTYIDNYTPSAKSLIIFIGQSFEQIHELPILISENAFNYGEIQIAPMLWLLDEYKPYLITLIDTEKAQLMTMYLGNVTSRSELESDRFAYDFGEKTLMPRQTSVANAGTQVTQGSNRDRFEDTMDEHIDHFYRNVAAEIETVLKRDKLKRIILGGSEQSAHALKDMLSNNWQEKIIAVLPIPMDSNDSEISKRVLPSALDYERQKEVTLVDDVIGLAKSDGRGALGQGAIEEALTQQRVELLIAPWEQAIDNKAIVEHLAHKTLQNGGEVEFVHGEAAQLLIDEGGMAARLYYAL